MQTTFKSLQYTSSARQQNNIKWVGFPASYQNYSKRLFLVAWPPWSVYSEGTWARAGVSLGAESGSCQRGQVSPTFQTCIILFNNVWNEHGQSDTWGTYPPTCPGLRWCIWSSSRLECIYRRKCLIFRFMISSCSQGVPVPRVSLISIKVQTHKRYEYILLKEWWSVSRLKSFVFRFKICSSSL